MAVNFERYRRIAIPEIFADGLNRHVLRQEQTAICMPESVTRNVFKSVFCFKFGEYVRDCMRV